MSEPRLPSEDQVVKRYDCGNGGAQYCDGCYQMERAEYGDYVPWEDYDRLLKAAAKLVGAVKDTLRSHPEALACCSVTKIRCDDAEKLLVAAVESAVVPVCDRQSYRNSMI